MEFGRYRLIELLGRGGMGEVWRADDSLTGRVVALKLLLPQCTDDEDFQRRFRFEARAAAALTDPHVVPIHGFGEIDGRLYVDMRLIEGRDLKSILDGGALSPGRAVHVVEQVAAALRAAHEVGLVHRDVKPSNVLVTGDDFAYLIDFGIARAAEGTRMTSTGAMMGTWAYMAPERFSADGDDSRSDVYALACVLYECLTGTRPFPGDSLERQYAGHVSTPPPRPSQVGVGVPGSFDEVIARGLAKDPDRRYQSVGELASAARVACADPFAFSGAATVGAPTVGAGAWASPTVLAGVPRRRRPGKVLLFTGAAAVVMTVVITAAAVLSDTDADDTPTTDPTSVGATAAPVESVLPLIGVVKPTYLAVGAAGDVYVSTKEPARVVTLPVGRSAPTDLGLEGFGIPDGLAVDSTGNVYVADITKKQVLKFSAASKTQSVLPFTDLDSPVAVAVDAAGNVYVADLFSSRILKLAPGSNVQTVLPFTDLNRPWNLASDAAGNLFVTEMVRRNRVITLPVDSLSQAVPPITGLTHPCGVAVDLAGNVFVADQDTHRVVQLASGSQQQSDVPFDNLQEPFGVAVDAAGAVYVTDVATYRVVKRVVHPR